MDMRFPPHILHIQHDIKHNSLRMVEVEACPDKLLLRNFFL